MAKRVASKGSAASVAKKVKTAVKAEEDSVVKKEPTVSMKKKQVKITSMMVKEKIVVKSSPKKPAKVERSSSDEEEEDVKPKGKGKAKAKAKVVVSTENILPDNWYEESKSKLFVGAHVSISGGLENMIIEAGSIGAQAIGAFLCSQRTWNIKSLEEDTVKKFNAMVEKYKYPKQLILPHASYLMNLGSPEAETRNKSRTLFLDGMSRCERLGISLYNFHPGSTCGKITPKESIKHIADAINWVHEKTKNVAAVIENMCKQGNTVGGDFQDIRDIIDLVKDKSRVGVCFDTCHGYAAGYDIKSEAGYKQTFDDFDKIIGLKYLKAFHLNDSMKGCGSHLDRHENIGKGCLGKDTFVRIMNDPRFRNLPMVLETPVNSDGNIYKKEIAMLYGMLKD